MAGRRRVIGLGLRATRAPGARRPPRCPAALPRRHRGRAPCRRLQRPIRAGSGTEGTWRLPLPARHSDKRQQPWPLCGKKAAVISVGKGACLRPGLRTHASRAGLALGKAAGLLGHRRPVNVSPPPPPLPGRGRGWGWDQSPAARPAAWAAAAHPGVGGPGPAASQSSPRPPTEAAPWRRGLAPSRACAGHHMGGGTRVSVAAHAPSGSAALPPSRPPPAGFHRKARLSACDGRAERLIGWAGSFRPIAVAVP